MTQNNPKPRASMIAPLPLALLLAAFFFLPWLRVSCDASQFTETMQRCNASETPMTAQSGAIPEITAKIGQASGWELAGGNISLDTAYARQDSPVGSDKPPLKSRTWLYMGLLLPVLALLLSWFGVTGKAKSTTVGTWLLLIGVAGTVIVILAASIDYVDDAIDHSLDQAAKSGGSGPTPCPAGLREAKSQMKKIVKTKGTVWLWSSLGMYVLLAGCGIAARSTPLGFVAEQETDSSPAFGNSMPYEGMRTPSQGTVPNFGPDLIPREPPPEKQTDGMEARTTTHDPLG
ncbi:MAG: hypothetical protein SVV80_09995 [Planctomycetota bacterium]|nr:hypothetical protein [Planctomycetota bacterium]